MKRQSDSAGPILLVANYESDVGYAWWLMENFWVVVAESATQHGSRCVLTYPRVTEVPAGIRRAPIEVIEFGFAYRSLRDIWRGLGLIRRRAIKSIYLTDWPYIHWAYMIWRLAGVRNIVVHDHTPGDRPAATGYRALFKSVIHALRVMSATRYVAVSDYIAVRLNRNGCIPRDRCLTVPNGIHLFPCNRELTPEVRQRIGIPKDAILVVMVSRATYYKNLDFAVRCFAELLRDQRLRDSVYVVHCGDGPDLGAFIALAEAGGISKNFRFLGRRTDVRQILCAADIAFHPSNGEAMSLSILEFMCADLAVVTSDLPSVWSALEPGVSGMTYRHGDLMDALSVLRRLVDDPALRKRLGTAARIRCQQRYGLDETNRLFAERVVPHLLNRAASCRP